MPHERLQRPRIDSAGRQGVTGGRMPKHASMDRERQLSGQAVL
jgi:hypothetical protein